MSLLIITTGGTLDKVYFDAKSEYEVGKPVAPHIFQEMKVTLDYELAPLMRKDSLDITKKDRQDILSLCQKTEHPYILITHGTDTMTETAKILTSVKEKTIVLTGAMAPACFRETDAIFNLGCALGAVQALSKGVYIAMNGQIFSAGDVKKNQDKLQFERKY